MEKIDILLATYNGQDYIKQQLDSILQQTYSNFRLIISDDKSKDNTVQIIKEYAKTDSRIQLFEQKENMGSNKNFEFLLSKVENEYFMLCDQDDVWKKDKIEKTYEHLKKEQCDLVFTDLELVDENLKTINKSFLKYKKLLNKIQKYGPSFDTLYLNNYVTGCTILVKKKYITKILPFPEKTVHLLHDYWIALVVSANGKIGYLNESTILYRQHNKNQVGSKIKSEELQSLQEIRNLFINVKIEHFRVLEKNKKLFEIKQEQTEKALNYYKHLQNVKYVNFKNWILFYKLYKYEEFRYFILNFLILNIPLLASTLWKIRRIFK